ncbi:ATP-binding protein [Tissierella sp. MB52-C2]|uniref:ATP-binding protein n=1 Tax=Tissierella sp. MB52-C2 TaxID=3070999 RepID=UPI00280BFEF8|nr:ATP-binding protein [Tissierella sp. MB52-C2]WMM26216.1 ATP-binding protein [Tissierella sp. MB52-C2]
MLDYYKILLMINAGILIISFLLLLKKNGYKNNMKFDIRMIFIFIVSVILIVIGLPFGNIIPYVLFIINLGLFSICRIGYNIYLKKSIIYSITYSLSYILMGSTVYWILEFSLKVLHNYILELNLLVNFFIMCFFIHYFDILKDKYNKKRYYIYILLILMINVIVFIFLNIATTKMFDLYKIITANNLEYEYSVDTLRFSLYMEWIFPYILFTITIILISLLIKVIKSEKEKAKMSFINEKLNMQYKYYLMIKNSQDKMKQIYHDMNGHIENIKSLKDNSGDVNKYIESIEDEVRSNINIYNTGNVLLDIILREKGEYCFKNSIEFIVGIDFRKCDFIEMIDISSIFVNIIDNAIEACDKVDDSIRKYISLKSTIVNGYYVLKCENSKRNKVLESDNKFFTSKKDKFFHGLGIESIKSSIKKYNGELNIKYNENSFIINIYIPIENIDDEN